MQQTTNFKLNLPEGSDLFAPMLDYNPNWSAIDNQMQLNRLNSMQEADCIFAGGVFQLTRKVKGASFFRFTAPADYTAGNTFTVDGEVFTAGLAGNFAALPDGAFTNGNIVVAYLDAGDAKKLAIMTGSSPLPNDIDAKTLEGHGADYFATAQALTSVNDTAVSAGNTANSAIQKARGAHFSRHELWRNSNPSNGFGAQDIIYTSQIPGEDNYARFYMLEYKTFTTGESRYSAIFPSESIRYPSVIIDFFTGGDGTVHVTFRTIQFTSKKATISSGTTMTIRSGGGSISPSDNTFNLIPVAIIAYYQKN